MQMINSCSTKRGRKLLILLQLMILLSACGESNIQKTNVDKNQFTALTLEVDISNKNCLAILLARDGTINRVGSGIVDSTDKDFFMGMTTEKLFDNLMETVSGDLMAYCNQAPPTCDTTRQICKVKFSFSGITSGIGGEYCINGTVNDLPKPIKEYIANAIKITGPWYQLQKHLLKEK
jgi:hypothetical protein